MVSPVSTDYESRQMPPDRFFDLAGQGSKDQRILCGIDSESWRSCGQGRRDLGARLLGEQGF